MPVPAGHAAAQAWVPQFSPNLRTSTICARNYHSPHGHRDAHLASHLGQDPDQSACAESSFCVAQHAMDMLLENQPDF